MPHRKHHHDCGPAGCPGFLPQHLQQFVNFLRMKINSEIIRPVARSLFIVDRYALHSVAIAEGFDISPRLACKRLNARVTVNVRIAGYFFEGVFQALAKNRQACLFPLARDNGSRLVNDFQ